MLALCCGQDDVVLGTVLLGRPPGTGHMLGMFINTLPLRVKLNAPANAVVQATKQQLAALLGHEQAPLALAQRCSSVAAPLPLFTSLLNYRHSAPLVAANADGGSLWQGVKLVRAEERTNYPLTLSVDDLPDGFALHLMASRTPDDVPDPNRVMAYVQGAIDALLAACEQENPHPLAQLTRLPEQEYALLTQDFNQHGQTAPAQLVHRLFEQWAERTPQATALEFQQMQHLSYAELNRQANSLAAHLMAQGIGPGQRVALLCQRGLPMIIALLAVLKAGAVYLPCDPAYPVARLRFMLEDSQSSMLLHDVALPAPLRPLVPHALRLDQWLAQWQPQEPAQDPAQEPWPSQAQPAASAAPDPGNPQLADLKPDDAAYLIYTSGSTGTPKGVINSHRGLANIAHAQTGLFGVLPHARVLQFASFSFDAATWEWVMALCHGATLVLATQEALLPGPDLIHVLQNRQISHATLPSSAAQTLADSIGDVAHLPSMTLIVAGEALPLPLAKQWATHHLFFNAYGPTETAICASVWRVPINPERVLIGRPIENCQIYILDPQLRPVPLGVVGEIFIGGAGVAHGYWQRPELTEQRFIDDPFTLGARLYRSGDLGRWLPDGNIDYIGRNDFQVKLRGYRIELGEIEAALIACDGVREALVMQREDVPGQKRLVAYCLAEAGRSWQALRLREQLARQLAEFMLPAAFVRLEQWPLTPAGKINRHALPLPDEAAMASSVFLPPEPGLETELAQLWQALLGLARVGRHDQFFALGGHSLLALQLVTRIKQALQVELPLRSLFVHGTLMAQAAHIANVQASEGSKMEATGSTDQADQSGTQTSAVDNPASLANVVVPLRARGSLLPVFVVHAGDGEIGYVRQLAQHWTKELPVYGIVASGLLAGETVFDTVEQMASHYVAALRQVQPHGPYRLAGWSAGGTIVLEMARQLQAALQRVEFVGLLDTAANQDEVRQLDQAAGLLDRTGRLDPAAVLYQNMARSCQLNGFPEAAWLSGLAQLAKLGDLRGMLAACVAAGLMPPELETAQLRRYLTVQDAIEYAIWQYRPRHLPLPIWLYLAKDQGHADPKLGWAKLAAQVQVVAVPGTHQTMIMPGQVEQLAALMFDAIEGDPGDMCGEC